MARNVLSGVVSALTGASCAPIVLFEGVFSGSTIRLWTGFGNLSWNGQTWLGNGWFQAMEGGEETIEVEAMDMTVVLSGVPSSMVSLVLGSQVQGALGSIYIGFLDASRAVIANPYLWWQGQYSHAEIEEEATETTIRLFYDGPLVDMDRPNEGRWTHEYQNRTGMFPGDKGFEYVVATANWSGNWGQGKKETSRPKPPKGTGKGKQKR